MTTTQPRHVSAAPPTAMLAQFTAGATVPDAVRTTTRRYLLDWLGSAVGGSEMAPPRMVERVALALGGSGEATILGSGTRTSPTLAALANGAASHVLEMDDLDRGSIFHPAAPIVAAALALGETLDLDGDALLDAIAVGYEVGIRVGEALGPSHYEHWHTTGTAGTLGAAAAAARVLGLDHAQTLDALGSAGTMTAGLWEFLTDGAMSKQLHPAKAAHDGILAALLAREGFTGARTILEGPKGLLAAMSGAPNLGVLTDGLSLEQQRWRVEQVSFKVHASCRHTHPAVDGALALRAQGVDPAGVERVHVRIYRQALGLLEGVEPTTPYAAKFSLPFCIAAALRFGDLGLSRFTDEAIRDADTLALADRVTFEPDPELDRMYPAAWPSIVTVRMRDGSERTARVDHPMGDPETDVTDGDLSEKFAMLVSGRLDHASARALAEEVLHGRAMRPRAITARLAP